MPKSRTNFGIQTNSVEPDQTTPLNSLIRVHTVVYSDLLKGPADDLQQISYSTPELYFLEACNLTFDLTNVRAETCCGRPWPAASINISQNIHQNQVLIKPLYSA